MVSHRPLNGITENDAGAGDRAEPGTHRHVCAANRRVRRGSTSSHSSPFPFVEQEYYRGTHLQTIEFEIARLIVDQLTVAGAYANDRRRRVLALQSRHQLFPQVFRYVDQYVRRKVKFQNCNACELGLESTCNRWWSDCVTAS